MFKSYLLLATLAFLCFVNCSDILAQQFRIESTVTSGPSSTAASENLTLYDGSMVYDFQMSLTSPGQVLEIVIFDSRQKLLVMLDVERRLRVDIPEHELIKMVEGLRTTAQQNEDALFLVNPDFEEEYDRSTGWISLSSPEITYRARGQSPSDTTVMPLFIDALNHFTRLSASDPQRLPPFPRIALNQSISKFGIIPTEIEMKIAAGLLSKNEISAASQHTPIWRLSNQDKSRIEQAKKQWMSYKKVSIGTYRGLTNAATAEARNTKN